MTKRLACFSILLLLACTDGTAPGGRPAIAFMGFPFPSSSSPNSEIYVVDSLGGQLTDVTHNPARDDDPTWSPDGAKIIFSSAGRDTTGRWHLFVTRDDGSGLTQFTSGAGSEWGPAWSPDGAKIAFISSSRLAVMNANGTGVTPLFTDTFVEDHPSWSPMGVSCFTQTGAQSVRVPATST